MNTLPPGSGSPSERRELMDIKGTYNFGIKQTLQITFYEPGQSGPLSSNLGALKCSEISSSSMVVTSFVCIEAIIESLFRLSQ